MLLNKTGSAHTQCNCANDLVDYSVFTQLTFKLVYTDFTT